MILPPPIDGSWYKILYLLISLRSFVPAINPLKTPKTADSHKQKTGGAEFRHLVMLKIIGFYDIKNFWEALTVWACMVAGKSFKYSRMIS
jgi:hypothetical protein